MQQCGYDIYYYYLLANFYLFMLFRGHQNVIIVLQLAHNKLS